jgi:hypothetical protein
VDQINAGVNKEGPGQWDAAVEIFLLKKYGVSPAELRTNADILPLKQPENAFFEYVAHGPTERMLDLILAKCPSRNNDSPYRRFQWIWERADSEKPPPNSLTMYWDCLTVANLYQDGPINVLSPPDPPVLGDVERAAEGELSQAASGVLELIDSLQSLLDGANPQVAYH